MKHKIFLFAFMISLPLLVVAHPHICTIVDIEFVFGDNSLNGIKVDWHFDDMTSSIALEEFDTNGNGQFEQVESDKILDENTILPENNYYFDIMLNGKPYFIDKIENFTAYAEGIHVSYSFFVPVNVSVDDTPATLKFEIYDKTYYSVFYLNQNEGVKFRNAEDYDYEVSFFNDADKAYYFGQVIPRSTKLIFKGRK